MDMSIKARQRRARAVWVTLAGALIQGACGEVKPEPDATNGGCSPPCEFPLNATPERPEAAWLRFTPQNGTEEDIPNVGSAAACQRAPHGGFYYDAPLLPTIMKACPCTCDRLKTPGTVKVIVGRGC